MKYVNVDELLSTLDLKTGATLDQVRQKYRDLAFVWHPDRFTGNSRLQSEAESKIKGINDAYEKLLEVMKCYGDARTTNLAGNASEELTGKEVINRALYAVKINGKIGYMNINGEMVIPAKYSRGPKCFERFASVACNAPGTYVIINNKDEEVCTRSNFICGDEEEGFYAGEIHEVSLLDANFMPTGKKYRWFRREGDFYVIEENDRYGVMDLFGNLCIEPVCESISIMNGFVIIRINGKHTILKTPGFDEINIPSDLTPMHGSCSRECDTLPVKSLITNKWGILDSSGNIIVHPNYSNKTFGFSCGLAKCENIRGSELEISFVDKHGNIQIQCAGMCYKPNSKYARIGDFFYDDLCPVAIVKELKLFGKSTFNSGYINKSGNICILALQNEPAYFHSGCEFHNGYAIVQSLERKTTKGVIAKDGSWIIDVKYDDIEKLKHNVFKASMSDSVFYYDCSGNLIKLKV